MRLPTLLLGACVAACAAAPEPRPKAAREPVKAPEIGKEQRDRLREWEGLWRKHDPKADPLRQELCADPATAWWLARTCVFELVRGVDQAKAADDEIVSLAGTSGDSRRQRALAELCAMGAAAVPCVREDLLRHEYADRRLLAVQILQAIGPDAYAGIAPCLSERDPVVRKAAVDAAAAMLSVPAARSAVEALLADPEFVVRGAAYAALGRLGPQAGGVLRRGLETDADPYVRRAIVQALGEVRVVGSAQAVFAYYTSCLAARDTRGLEAADAALARLSGRKPPGNEVSWRSWLATLPADPAHKL